MQKLFNLSRHKNIRRILRQQPIACEHILWGKIRNRQLGDLKFKRQFSIGRYIVDFYCAEAKLVIELDGATHGSDKEVRYDNLRQKFLESQGVIVKRYTNTDIKENLEGVLENILAAGGREVEYIPSPQPSPERERG
jgi:very-short-patch-repair endonuclease